MRRARATACAICTGTISARSTPSPTRPARAVERLSYGAFGKRRIATGENAWTDPALAIAAVNTPRGFTGHEHLDDFQLVHMNGRVYDPSLGRFMSADPFVQFAESTQGLNRYAYVDNNPLSFTDPSGYFFDFDDIFDDISDIFDDIYDYIFEFNFDYQLGVFGWGYDVAGFSDLEVEITWSVDAATGEHYYRIRGKACDEGPGCDDAYSAAGFNYSNARDVPFSRNDVGRGRKDLFYGTQPIDHYEFPAIRLSVNDTLEGHMFHRGHVSHHWSFENGALYYDVIGQGTGPRPLFNVYLGILTFAPRVYDTLRRFER